MIPCYVTAAACLAASPEVVSNMYLQLGAQCQKLRTQCNSSINDAGSAARQADPRSRSSSSVAGSCKFCELSSVLQARGSQDFHDAFSLFYHSPLARQSAAAEGSGSSAPGANQPPSYNLWGPSTPSQQTPMPLLHVVR